MYYLDAFMFAAALILLLRGYPVAFTLAGVGLLFALLGSILQVGLFATGDLSFIKPFYSRIFGLMDEVNEVLVAVPLFIFMGVMLERSQVAGELLENMGRLFGKLRGGVGISVTLVGMLLAASTGIVGATVVTMGLISLPTMLRHNYSKPLACGSIAAAGTLGQIIPPSIVLVILGDQISSEYVEARRAVGDWSPDPVSVGDLFVGALLPGLMLVLMYIAYQIGMAIFRPESSPAIKELDPPPLKEILRVLVPPVGLIISVLGSILAGVATPTEAAAVGAVGSVLLAGERLTQKQLPLLVGVIAMVVSLILAATFDLRLNRDVITTQSMVGIVLAGMSCLSVMWAVLTSVLRVYKAGVLTDVMQSTTKITVMVFVILIGAQLFNLSFRGLGGDEHVHALLSQIPGGAFGAMLAVMLVMFLLGFFLDFLEIMFVVIPIVAPVLFKLDLNPVWVAIMIGMNLQTSFLTPPFGFALFYLRGVAPPEVKTSDIYKGVAPFVAIQMIALAILAAFPELATWLPKVVFG